MATPPALLLILLAAVLLAGCSGGAPAAVQASPMSTPATASPAPPTSEVSRSPLSLPLRTPLAPGTYVADRFAVPLSFSVDASGWEVIEHAPEFLAVGIDRPQGLRGEVNVVAIRRVFDPDTSQLGPAPDDLASWLRSHARIAVLDEEPVSLRGLEAQRLRLRASDDAVVLAPPPAGAPRPYEVRIDPSMHEILVATADSTPLFITTYAEVPDFRSDAERLIASFDLR